MKKPDDDKIQESLIQSFAACKNYPKERAGISALSQALKRASDDFHVSMEEIVRTCCDISTHCPVPREIRNVAIGIRDDRRRQKETNQHSEWRRIYGAPDADWPAQLMGVLVEASNDEQRRACHIRAVRDMLFYTEGDGREIGDREFWERTARPADVEHYHDLVDQVRLAGGWKSERELQMDWIDIAWQAPATHHRSKAS